MLGVYLGFISTETGPNWRNATKHKNPGSLTAQHFAGIHGNLRNKTIIIRNQQVRCSSHPTSSNLPFRHTSELGGIPEWPKGADCKSVVSDFGGSNSPPPTKKSDILWIPDFFAPFCCICFFGKYALPYNELLVVGPKVFVYLFWQFVSSSGSSPFDPRHDPHNEMRGNIQRAPERTTLSGALWALLFPT